MVATPDIPADVDRSTEHKGSAVGTPGLGPLDEEREASLADEGGASGAHVESQERLAERPFDPAEEARPRRRFHGGLFLAALAAGALGAFALRKR